MASSQDSQRERVSMARVAALLLVAGAVLGLVQIAVPHSASIDTRAYALLDTCGLIAAAIVWVLRERLPVVAYHAFSAFGIVIVSISIYYSGNRSGEIGRASCRERV